MFQEILSATQATLFTALAAAFLAAVISLPMSLILSLTKPNTIKNKPLINTLFSFFISTANHFTFITVILLFIAFNQEMKFTSSIDIVTIAALTFVATVKITLGAQKIIDRNKKNLIETGRALGASNYQIVKNLIIPNTSSRFIGLTLSTFNELVSYSLVAGLAGASGLGKLMYTHSAQHLNFTILFISMVIILFINFTTKLVTSTSN